MNHKLVTKTIVISIIALLVLSAAITGTVLLLKQSGEVATIGKVYRTTETGTIQNTEDNKTVEYKNQAEPEPTTIEREKIISETIILGWNKLDLNSVISENELEINYNNLDYKVEYYFDGILDEELTTIIGKNSKGKIIDSYEEKVKVGYKLDKVENLPLTITKNQEENVIKVYYEKASYDYTIYYYKDSITGENFLGRIPGVAEFESKITADTTKFIPKEGYVFEGTAPSMTICSDSAKNILNVIYTKVNDLSYTINYLEKGTNKLLKTETVSNQEFNKIITIADLEVPNTITANSKEYTYSNQFTTAQEPPVTGQITIGTNLSLNVINFYYERPEIKTEKTSTVTTNATQPGKAYPGDEITYAIKVWNEGSGSKKVKIEDKVPNGTTIVPNSESKNSGNVSVENGRITWKVNVQENTSKEDAKVLTFKVTINNDATGTIKNTANVDGKTGPNDGDGYDVIKPADITVSKESQVIDTNSNGILEYGEKIQYTLKASNSGDDTGNVIFKDNDLKENIDNRLVTLVEKTGYTGTNQELIDALAENGVSLTVKGGKIAEITYTVEVVAKAGTKISNKVEVTAGGAVDKEKEETKNTVEKISTVVERSETIKGTNVVLVIDTSGSMSGSKLKNAKEEAKKLIDKVIPIDGSDNGNSTISVVEYKSQTEWNIIIPVDVDYAESLGTAKNITQANTLKQKIDNLSASGKTPIATGLTKANEVVERLKSNANNNVVILLSDGEPTDKGYDKVATKMKNSGITIYTIGFNTNTSADNVLKGIASPGKNMKATDNLSEVFNTISSSISDTPKNVPSLNGKIELSNKIYADSKHQITIKVNGVVDTTLNSLPTDITGKVIKEDGKYYLDLNKFEANAKISIIYFSK